MYTQPVQSLGEVAHTIVNVAAVPFWSAVVSIAIFLDLARKYATTLSDAFITIRCVMEASTTQRFWCSRSHCESTISAATMCWSFASAGSVVVPAGYESVSHGRSLGW